MDDIIRNLRKRHYLTQAEFAKKSALRREPSASGNMGSSADFSGSIGVQPDQVRFAYHITQPFRNGSFCYHDFVPNLE